MQDKPVFIRALLFIVKLPIRLVYYFLLGIFFTITMISYAWWKFLKYLFMGILFPFVIIGRAFGKKPKKAKEDNNTKEEVINKTNDTLVVPVNDSNATPVNNATETPIVPVQPVQPVVTPAVTDAKEEAAVAKTTANIEMLNEEKLAEEHREKNEHIRLLNLQKVKERQAKIDEEKEKRNELEKQKKLEEQGKPIVIKKDEDVKKGLGYYINAGLEAIISVPKKLSKSLKNEEKTKHKLNKKEMEMQAIVLDFDGEDAKKTDKKLVYEYVGKDPDGKIGKGYFSAFSKVEVHSFLLSEGYEVYSIKTNPMIQMFHGSQEAKGVRFKTKDLIFFLTQLSTYVKAGIPLVESLRILKRQFPQKGYQKVFRAMIYDLTMGDSFSSAMEKQEGAFPKILSNMVKTSEMTGELPEILDDMQVYFEEADKTRKQMITALTYPLIVFVLAIGALVFIMLYIVPQFVTIYEGMDNAQLPGITLFILSLSNFIKTKWMYILATIAIVIVVFIYLYKNVKLFKTFIQWALMHLPIIGDVIIYNEVTMFTKTFASLLKHNVFITDTMDILNKITNNEIWKSLILETITNLSKGDKISLAFKGHWAVPIPAYEMIVTGERTGQLPEMMQKVSDYYQELHKNAVGRIKSFIEPLLILFLTGAVGVIVLSIIIPMFDMYKNLS